MTARNELTWIDFIWWVSLPSRFVLELMIVIEDRFADVVITDEDADQLEIVGFERRGITEEGASVSRIRPIIGVC